MKLCAHCSPCSSHLEQKGQTGCVEQPQRRAHKARRAAALEQAANMFVTKAMSFFTAATFSTTSLIDGRSSGVPASMLITRAAFSQAAVKKALARTTGSSSGFATKSTSARDMSASRAASVGECDSSTEWRFSLHWTAPSDFPWLVRARLAHAPCVRRESPCENEVKSTRIHFVKRLMKSLAHTTYCR